MILLGRILFFGRILLILFSSVAWIVVWPFFCSTILIINHFTPSCIAIIIAYQNDFAGGYKQTWSHIDVIRWHSVCNPFQDMDWTWNASRTRRLPPRQDLWRFKFVPDRDPGRWWNIRTGASHPLAILTETAIANVGGGRAADVTFTRPVHAASIRRASHLVPRLSLPQIRRCFFGLVQSRQVPAKPS
jgi:hypothetical protein